MGLAAALTWAFGGKSPPPKSFFSVVPRSSGCFCWYFCVGLVFGTNRIHQNRGGRIVWISGMRCDKCKTTCLGLMDNKKNPCFYWRIMLAFISVWLLNADTYWGSLIYTQTQKCVFMLGQVFMKVLQPKTLSYPMGWMRLSLTGLKVQPLWTSDRGIPSMYSMHHVDVKEVKGFLWKGDLMHESMDETTCCSSWENLIGCGLRRQWSL